MRASLREKFCRWTTKPPSQQPRMSIETQIKTWVMHACDHLITTKTLDKHIRFRVAKYVSCQRAEDAKASRCSKAASSQLRSILLSIAGPKKRGLDDITIASSGEAHDEKRRNTGPLPVAPVATTSQDGLQLGAEASCMQLQIPANLRGRLRSPAEQHRAHLEALAKQMAERKDHERRAAAQRRQIAAMDRQVQENK